MKNTISLFLFFFINKNIYAQDKFLGFWTNESKTQTIQIYILNERYYGRLVDSDSLYRKTNTQVLIINQMDKRGKNVLFGGTYFDEITKNEYEIKIKLVNENCFFLKRSRRLFSKKKYWTIVDNNCL